MPSMSPGKDGFQIEHSTPITLGTQMPPAHPPYPSGVLTSGFFLVYQGTAIEKSKEYPPNWAWQIQGPYARITPSSLFSAAAASSGFAFAELLDNFLYEDERSDEGNLCAR